MKFIESIALLGALSTLVVAAPAPAPQRGGGRGGSRSSSIQRAGASTQAAAGGTGAAASVASGQAAQQPAASSRTATGASTTTGSTSGSTGAGAGSGSDSSDTTSGSTSASGSGHDITVINQCGGGHVEWKYNGGPGLQRISGTQHVSGPVVAGIMWLQGYNGVTCSADGAGCGIIEFTLGDNDFNSINYSLLQEGLGDHDLQAPMYFTMQGPGCDKKADGVCQSADNCPGAYTGTDTMSGTPPTCSGNDGVGVTITFCP